LIQDLKNGSASVRCEGINPFLVALSGVTAHFQRFVLVLDGIDQSRETLPTLLPSLARAGEIVSNSGGNLLKPTHICLDTEFNHDLCDEISFLKISANYRYSTYYMSNVFTRSSMCNIGAPSTERVFSRSFFKREYNM